MTAGSRARLDLKRLEPKRVREVKEGHPAVGKLGRQLGTRSFRPKGPNYPWGGPGRRLRFMLSVWLPAAAQQLGNRISPGRSEGQ